MRNLRARGFQLSALLVFLVLLILLLRTSRSPSYDDLLDQFQSPHPSVRREALLQIEIPYDSQFLSLLLLALEDADPEIRQNAFQILQKTPPDQLLPFLPPAFEQHSTLVRQQLLQLLGTFGPLSAPLLPFLLQNYSKQNISVQREFLAQIPKFSSLSPDIFALLKKALKHETIAIRQQAFVTLATLHPLSDLSFEPYFILALHDPVPEIRVLAIQLLDQMQSRTALSALLLTLKDPHLLVRDQATQTFIHFGKLYPEILPLLITATQNADPLSREALLKIFFGIGKPAINATPFVLNCLQDPDELIQLHATQCAGIFQSIAAVPYLLPFLKNHSLPLFSATLKSLGQIQHPQAIPDLIRLLYEAPKEHRPLISWTLAQMPPKALFPALKPLLQDTKVYLRRQALWILGELKDPIGVFALALALRDEDYLVRREAIQSIGKLGTKAQIILSDIEKAVTDIDEEVRLEATRILSTLQEKNPSKE